ncbi:uncharacterized protein LOC114252105 isoform X2 [Bombyx mandarina]|uniref:Regulatory protein zeste n=3 Tax=Bombyx TaxID=7090 RepID=A0A8R2C8R0_BOMMO|nr:uncharacterized protein LOC101742906 isoform X2 [Bombyx mori]XP_028042412.1 uncharacterized protein LOC114252105 isoform X2 [Bombyx mandarina]
MKTSQHQFELLVTIMEEHGDLSKPSSSARGRMAGIKHWEELTSLLNSDGSGDTKTTEKWKKVWSDFKNNTKKKAARMYKFASRTGGGPALNTKLTELEQRVLNIIGMQTATGLAVAEAGISQDIVVSQPRTPVQSGNTGVELCNEPGPSGRIYTGPSTSRETQVETTPHNQAFNVDIEIVEDVVPTSYLESAFTAPQSPVQYGPTTPRRRERPSRVRSPLQRRARLTQTEHAALLFRNSDSNWRAFKIDQHKDFMEMRKDRNRVREMEVQAQREWQAMGLSALDLLTQVVNKFCKD